MKRTMTFILSVAVAMWASACNFASLNDAPKVSRAESLAKQQGRFNEGAFRPIISAPVVEPEADLKRRAPLGSAT